MAQSYVVKGNNAVYSKNEIVDDNNVLFQIEDWDFTERDDQTILLKLKILTGIKKGNTMSDLVTFDPEAKMNWKYKALRSAIGQPIPKDGDDAFDLIKLVGQLFVGDLRKSKEGKYQNVQYKKYDPDTIDILRDEVGDYVEEPQAAQDNDEFVITESVNEDDLPF